MKATFLTSLSVLLLAGVTPVLAQGPIDGTVTELGFGKFKLTDKDNVVRLFNEAKNESKYEPVEWRPVVGDAVSVTYTKVEQKLRVDSVKLVKAGPNTVVIKSPIEIEVSEVGKSAIRGRIPAQDNKEVKFLKTKESKMTPDGWVPTAGEKAKVEFTAKGAVINFGINYMIDKMEKIAAFSPPPATAPAAADKAAPEADKSK